LRLGERHKTSNYTRGGEKIRVTREHLITTLRILLRQLCHLSNLYQVGYTSGMKTAVSIPDDVFEGAERLARRTRRSRSRLFSDALREYLARHSPDELAEAVDKACTEIGDTRDPFVAAAAGRILERTEW